jgi:hypothetical protein
LRRRGVTLIEYVVGFALLPLLFGGVIWALRVAFQTQAILERDIDTLDRALRLTIRISRDTATSRGLVRFTPAGKTEQLDGLRMRGNRIFTYGLTPDGQVWQSVYNYPSFTHRESFCLGKGYSYFHLIQLERGIHMNIDVGQDPAASKAALNGAFIDLATAVQPRHW